MNLDNRSNNEVDSSTRSHDREQGAGKPATGLIREELLAGLYSHVESIVEEAAAEAMRRGAAEERDRLREQLRGLFGRAEAVTGELGVLADELEGRLERFDSTEPAGWSDDVSEGGDSPGAEQGSQRETEGAVPFLAQKWTRDPAR